MSVRIFKDVEEGLAREFRAILTSELRTATEEVLQGIFDPFTGDLIKDQPIEGRFFDSSANARYIEYPHIYIKILRSLEDIDSGRIVSPYGKSVKESIVTSEEALNIVLSSSDSVRATSSSLLTSAIKARLISNLYLLRILEGPNKGTYKISSVVLTGNGPHTVNLDSVLLNQLPASVFEAGIRKLTFLQSVDLNTVAAGDTFTDSGSNNFSISSVDVEGNAIYLVSSINNPLTGSNSSISRLGGPLATIDTTPRRFMILDPTKPVIGKSLSNPDEDNTDQVLLRDWSIPLDLIFKVTVDTKVRDDHISVLNRVWEEFNPPRRGLSLIVRSKKSAESLLATNLPLSGSDELQVRSISGFNINDPVRIANMLTTGLETKIIGINSDTSTLKLADSVPNTFTLDNGTFIVSNSDLFLWEWDFISHRDASDDGSHYWSQVFEYRVQVWVEKKQSDEIRNAIKEIDGTIENLQSVVLDNFKVP